MPKRDKFKKQGNQSSVASLFGENTRANSSMSSTTDNQEVEPLSHSSASAERLNITGVPTEVNPLVLTEDNRNFTPVTINKRTKRR